MRRATLITVVALAAGFVPACDTILGIDDHGVAPDAGEDSAGEGSFASGEGGTDATLEGAASGSSGGEGAAPEVSGEASSVEGAVDQTAPDVTPDVTADRSTNAAPDSASDAVGDSTSGDGMPGDATAPLDAPGEASAADGGPADAKTDVQDASTNTDASGGCDAPCTRGGPAMVPVTTYYVDSTEVTVAQYQQFLTAKGSDISGQPTACSWNTSYTPVGASGTPNFPITGVDWCDAVAFCTWAGKHLCGTIADGGAIAAASALNQSVSQWVLACGGPNGWIDPNGNPMCNANGGTGDLIAVASDEAGCEGYYPGLFDLEGNAAEWIDSCDVDAGAGGASDTCYALGGSFLQNYAECQDVPAGLARNTTAYSIGFRCCHQ